MKMELPKNLRYSEHVWVSVEGDTATLGITDYALATTKEIVFIDLPEVGRILKRGVDFVSLESVKWSGHVESPVDGEVLEVNGLLFDDPSKLNSDPYGSWICKVKLIDPTELESLMDAKAAEMWVEKT